MKLIKPIVLGIIVIAVAGGLAWSGSQKSTKPPVPTTETATTDAQSGTTYTMADVAKNATAANCWTTINGSVYNLTDWVSKHPGGQEAIKSICGKDGSAAFNAQHGGAKLQQDILKGYKVGTLAK